MSRWLMVLTLTGLFFGASGRSANFPQKVSLVLKQKVSCRDAKRLVRSHRLFVHCTEKDPFSRNFEAVYLGHEPLPSVLGELSSNAKVEAAAPYGELTFSGPIP